MNISSVNSLSDITNSVGPKTLGKEDFLKLLLEQLSHQDPLNPMDSTEFTVQLTQFTSLEELNNINSTLNEVLAFQHSMQNAAVANLIGKTVTASGNTIYLKDSADIRYELLEDASSVEISIIDSTGKIVKSEELGSQKAGDQIYLWDGKDNYGNQLPEGTYIFEIEALNGPGDPVNVLTSTSGIVTGVYFEDGTTYLILDGGRNVHLTEIQSIRERGI
jgi:flagellar basal-body rod modification protein FlgD